MHCLDYTKSRLNKPVWSKWQKSCRDFACKISTGWDITGISIPDLVLCVFLSEKTYPCEGRILPSPCRRGVGGEVFGGCSLLTHNFSLDVLLQRSLISSHFSFPLLAFRLLRRRLTQIIFLRGNGTSRCNPSDISSKVLIDPG